MTVGELKKALESYDDNLEIQMGVTALYQEHTTALFPITGFILTHDIDKNQSVVIVTPPQEPIIKYNP